MIPVSVCVCPATHNRRPLAPEEGYRQEVVCDLQLSPSAAHRAAEGVEELLRNLNGSLGACHLAATPPSPAPTIRVAEDSGRSHVSTLTLCFQAELEFSRPVESRLRISSPDAPPGSWL